jgi:hypothetical protein
MQTTGFYLVKRSAIVLLLRVGKEYGSLRPGIGQAVSGFVIGAWFANV